MRERYHLFGWDDYLNFLSEWVGLFFFEHESLVQNLQFTCFEILSFVIEASFMRVNLSIFLYSNFTKATTTALSFSYNSS
jgi:hypothetical protein